MALFEHPVDLALGLLAMAGGPARTERRPELRVCHPVAPRLPARQTLRLAWQVLERHLDRLETAAQTLGTDLAVIALRFGNARQPRLKQLVFRVSPTKDRDLPQ